MAALFSKAFFPLPASRGRSHPDHCAAWRSRGSSSPRHPEATVRWVHGRRRSRPAFLFREAVTAVLSPDRAGGNSDFWLPLWRRGG